MGGSGSPRVAVIGAGGIGKHHAKWWAIEGAEVCAFAGTSDESVARTRETLVGLFGFAGRGYTGVGAMLEAEGPEIVDVCTPPPCHAGHVRTAIEAGCDVLCEKPFVYDAALSREDLIAQAEELEALAEDKGRKLGVCTQYSVGARVFQRIWNERRGGGVITQYHGHLESPAKGREPDPQRVWIDLSPHPISVLLNVIPGGEVDWDTLETRFEGYEAHAGFQVRSGSGAKVECTITTRNATDPPLNVRHFKFNGYPFVVEGQNDAEGVYCARIETPDGECLEPDMMRALIREFLAGRPPVSAAESIRNLDIMLRILSAAA